MAKLRRYRILWRSSDSKKKDILEFADGQNILSIATATEGRRRQNYEKYKGCHVHKIEVID